MNDHSLLTNMLFPKNTFKISNFLIRSLNSYNINQISRNLGISVGSVHKILKNLENFNIVHSKNMGNAIYYSFNFEYNQALKLSHLILIEDKNKILKENKVAGVYAFDLEKFDAKAIILFGSILTKKNEAKDVDVLFIIKNKEQVKKVNDFCLSISKIRTKKINPLIMLEQDFINNLKNKNKALQDLTKNGIILKGEDIFIRGIKNAR